MSIIIAEAGVNHNGDIRIAKAMIDVAAASGADYIKFQTFRAESLASGAAKKADYQLRNAAEGFKDDSQLKMLQGLELSKEDHFTLMNHCKMKNIKFLSSAFDLASLDFLISLDLDLIKIPSGEINNLPYLRKAGAAKKSIVLSTGMSDTREINDALEVLIKSGTDKRNVTVLHCTTEYPAPYEEVHLPAMNQLKEFFGINVGYSDHTIGIEISIAAVALGATVIEKHFTLDRNMQGPDHKASIEPEELKQMVKSIRHVEAALRNKEKVITASELKNRAIARKSIHLAIQVNKDHVFDENDLVMKRPGDGISPMKLDEILGKRAAHDLIKDQKLAPEDFY